MTHWSDLLCNRSQKSSPADSFVKCSHSGRTQAYVVPKDVELQGLGSAGRQERSP